MKQKQRNSNIELLRIVAMLMIVAHHFSCHGGFDYDVSSISINRIWIQYLQLGGKIGVDVFVLISGYFLISSKSTTAFRTLKLWLQLLFYSIGIYIVSVALGISEFSKIGVFTTLIPVSTNQWWFASTYLILFLLSPFLNAALTHMSKKQFKRILGIVLVIWCALPTLSGLCPGLTAFAPQLSNLTWFATLYAIAAYIRLWHTSLPHTARYYLAISVGAVIVTLLSAILFDYLDVIQQSVVFEPTVLFNMTSITIVIAAVAALLGFLQIDMPCSRLINTIASASFGVYLLHDHSITRPLLWETIFKNAAYADSNMLIPYSVAVIISVYMACVLVELIRKNAIEKPLLGVISRASKSIDDYLDKKLG